MSTETFDWRPIVRSAIAGMPDGVSERISLLDGLISIVPEKARARTLLARAREGLEQHRREWRAASAAGMHCEPREMESVSKRDRAIEAALRKHPRIGDPARASLLNLGSGLWMHMLALRQLSPKGSNGGIMRSSRANGTHQLPRQSAFLLN